MNDVSTQEHIPEVSEAGGLMQFFVLKPVFGLLLVVLIVASGLMAYNALIKESLPDLAIPQATIATFWPGADPQTIEQEVTEKIENELSSLKGVKKVTSASFDSYSMIAVEFVAEACLDRNFPVSRTQFPRPLHDLAAELLVSSITSS